MNDDEKYLLKTSGGLKSSSKVSILYNSRHANDWETKQPILLLVKGIRFKSTLTHSPQHFFSFL